MGGDTRDREVAVKLTRVRDFMASRGFGAVVLGRRDDFAWLTAGGDNHCAYDTESGIASLVITAGRQYAVTNNIEADRLTAEELPACFEPVVHPWHEGPEEVMARLLHGLSTGSDYGLPGAAALGQELTVMRGSLTEWEIERYRTFAPDVTDTVEKVCRQIEPGMSEHQVEARTIQALAERGFAFPVVLVGADERLARFRHPVPTERCIEKRCMVVVCAQYGGLTVALTRIVQFGPLPDDLRRRHDAVTAIDATFISGSRAGRRFRDILNDGIGAYEATGFGGEWTLHHQGGPIGYQTREFLVTPATMESITAPQAVAWNPSVAGTKSEDTLLVTGQGVEVLTKGASGWPMVWAKPMGANEAISRPDILLG